MGAGHNRDLRVHDKQRYTSEGRLPSFTGACSQPDVVAIMTGTGPHLGAIDHPGAVEFSLGFEKEVGARARFRNIQSQK